LIQQGLKKVVILTIDDRDFEPALALQTFRRIQAGETGTHDDDTFHDAILARTSDGAKRDFSWLDLFPFAGDDGSLAIHDTPPASAEV